MKGLSVADRPAPAQAPPPIPGEKDRIEPTRHEHGQEKHQGKREGKQAMRGTVAKDKGVGTLTYKASKLDIKGSVAKVKDKFKRSPVGSLFSKE